MIDLPCQILQIYIKIYYTYSMYKGNCICVLYQVMLNATYNVTCRSYQTHRWQMYIMYVCMYVDNIDGEGRFAPQESVLGQLSVSPSCRGHV